MRVTLWGTRGSLTTPKSPARIEERIRDVLYGFLKSGGKQFEDVEPYLSTLTPCQFGGFGGETLCVEVTSNQERLIIDSGSGIRRLGYQLMKDECSRGRGELHLFYTHFHWDHLAGLPFFVPLFVPGNRIHVYAVQPELPDVFRTVFQKPYFPLTLEQVDAKLEFHILKPRQPFKLADFTITPYQLDHPDPCWGYRIEADGKVFSHCVDNEMKRVTREDLGNDLPLYQGINLAVMDAQYTLLEAMEKVNWGHASASVALDIAMREGIEQVLFVHHDPAATDRKIALADEEARGYYDKALQMATNSKIRLHPVKWSFAGDGTCVDL
ncbi:MBL fold metallo-hydrolase [Pseudanabaena sp. PCC 6802]|uniref:MBL fold metallo-hydrolase n=1 Tax=Pseudanabaena sp. PCC 6802 TaxID=118173 RepID=UPI00037675F8|nr:MBL fold metallo-hydrolase [Pseudanabaena sp. PCC 6802]